MVNPTNSNQVQQNISPQPATSVSSTAEAKTESVSAELQTRSVATPQTELSSRKWSLELERSANRGATIVGLKLGKFGKSELPSLKKMKAAVEASLQGRVEGDGVIARIARAVRSVFANIFTNRKQELTEMKDLIDNHIREIEETEAGTNLLKSSDSRDKQIGAIIDHLQSSEAFKEEGIFRLNGSKTFIEAWKKDESVDRNGLRDFKNLTSILKDQLGEDFAKSPGIGAIIRRAKECVQGDDSVDQAKAAQLRDAIYSEKPYASDLFKLLNTVVANKLINKMTIESLLPCIATKLNPGGLSMSPGTTQLFRWMIENPE